MKAKGSYAKSLRVGSGWVGYGLVFGQNMFEKLKGLKASKDKSKELNRKLNYWLRRKITEKVKEKGLENGYRIDEIYPQHTSKRCSKCGAIGGRFLPKGSFALFGCPCCGYVVNADVNAVLNQFFIYLSYLLKAGREDRSVVRLGEFPKNDGCQCLTMFFWQLLTPQYLRGWL